MVVRKNLKKKFALISVFEKKNLKYLCSNLAKYNYNFISSGSTGNKIRDLGFKCQDISKITKFKEMFGGRVKTLNPKIYSSLLYIRDDKKHKQQFISLNIPEIDIVVVNLYPFKENPLGPFETPFCFKLLFLFNIAIDIIYRLNI